MLATLPLFAVLALGLLVLVPVLLLLHSTARVVEHEKKVWNLRNDVERLHYNYQLQLHRLVTGQDESPSSADEELGQVDILEDEPASAA